MDNFLFFPLHVCLVVFNFQSHQFNQVIFKLHVQWEETGKNPEKTHNYQQVAARP